MKIKLFLLLGIVIFITLSTKHLTPTNVQDDYYPPSVVPDRIMLSLTTDPATSMAINWRSSVGVEKSLVQVAKAEAHPDFADSLQTYIGKAEAFLSDRSGAKYHYAILDGLAPNTTYAYRVGDEKHWSEWSHFKTASLEAAPISFIYFGDAQNDIKSMWSRTVRGAYSQRPKADFLLHAGDLINRANRDHEWGEWFYAGGWIYRTMPSIATPGNHEYAPNDIGLRTLSHHWRPTFTLPENGPPGLEETVYYIDYQDMRIISLNSQAFKSFQQDSAKQVDWLKPVLQNNPNKWTVVTLHHPIYSSSLGRDNKKLRMAFQPLFEEYKVDLVLQGHDHSYSRGSNLPLGNGVTTIGGPIYVVSVSGPKMYVHGLENWMQRAATNTQLYQIIQIEGDILTFEAFTATDELYDAFELHKQPGGRNIFHEKVPPGMPERMEIPKRYQESFSDEERAQYNEKFKAYKEKREKAADR